MHATIRIATRKSPLALRQAELAAAALRARFPELRVETVPMTTRGDTPRHGADAHAAHAGTQAGADTAQADAHAAHAGTGGTQADLHAAQADTHAAQAAAHATHAGGKGLFTRELERGLLDGRADIAVHSMKDVPGQLPGGLVIAAVMAREDASDVFVCNAHDSLEQLPEGAVVGTASLRRQCQIRHRFPHLKVAELHGNVGTRLAKLDAGEYAGLILAGAGLKRLGLDARIRSTLPHDVCLPAVGQGAIGIECRDGDDAVLALVRELDDAPTRVCIETERTLARRLGADCRWPLAVHASLHGGVLRLRALVGDLAGRKILRDERSGAAHDGALLAAAAAEALLAQGAGELLAAFTAQSAAPSAS